MESSADQVLSVLKTLSPFLTIHFIFFKVFIYNQVAFLKLCE